MILHTQSDPSRLDAANAGDLRRASKPADWLLSIVFAALLGAAVWKLDHATAAPAPSAAPTPGLLARTTGVVRELLESLIVRDLPDRGLSAAQTAPEGWPAWDSEQAYRPPSAQCVRPDGPRDAAVDCH